MILIPCSTAVLNCLAVPSTFSLMVYKIASVALESKKYGMLLVSVCLTCAAENAVG